MASWIVESHHINVTCGDCAIHLLVKQDVTNKQNTVYSAVLIDGGVNSRKIPGLDTIMVAKGTAIQSMIDWINNSKRYLFANGTSLVFDTIVVTHWDQDHHAGIVATLVDSVVLSSKNKNAPIPYLKWDAKGNPLTVFYCPNVSTSGTGANKLNGLARKLSTKTVNGVECIQVTVNKSATTPKSLPPYPFAQLVYAAGSDPLSVWNVLGVNFFNNAPCKPKGKPMTPSDLVRNNLPNGSQAPDGRPGMYCIGVMRKTFDLPNAVEIVINKSVTMTNRVSIAAAILWPDTTDATKPPRCSHYFAGDLEDIFETQVINWLSGKRVSAFTSAKLSHHGSHSSTPINMITNFSPTNIRNLIASNPNGGYFHPAWELVLVASIWAQTAPQGAVPPRLWATKYPFYLSQDKDGNYTNVKPASAATLADAAASSSSPRKVGVNMDAFKSNKTDFVNWMTTQYGSLKKAGPGVLTEYEMWLNAKTAGDVLSDVIMDLVRAKWQAYCFPGPFATPATSSATSSPALAMASSSDLIESLVVISSNDAKSDGSIFLKLYRSDQLFEAPNNQSTAATASSNNNSATLQPVAILAAPSNPLTVPTKKRKRSSSSVDNGLVLGSLSDADLFDPGLGTDPNEMDIDSENAYDKLSTDDVIVGNGLPVIPGPPIGDPSLAPWYIWSSATSSTTITTKIPHFTDFNQTTAASSWDGIVSTLHCGMLALSQNPTAVAVGSPITLDPTDEWGAWMIDCVGAKEFSLITSGIASDANIGGFKFVSQLPPLIVPNTSGAIRAQTLPVLAFSTDPVVLANTFAPAVPPPFGIRDGSTSLVFGLDASVMSQGATLQVSDLIAFVGLSDELSGPLISLVIGPWNLNLPTSAAQAKGRRNAIWFQPQAAYKTTTRLEFDLSPAAQTGLNNLFGLLGKFTIDHAALIARRSSIWSAGTTGINVNSTGSLTLVAEIELTSYGIELDVSFELKPSTLSVDLVLQSESSKIVAWLTDTLNLPSNAFDFQSWLTKSAGPVNLNSFQFRRVRLEFNIDPTSGNITSFSTLLLDVELKIITGSGASQQTLLFLLSYKYVNGVGGGSSVEADLWPAPSFDFADTSLYLLPDFEDYAFFTPLSVSDWTSMGQFLDLGKLAGFENAPHEIPKAVTQAKLMIGSGGIAFTATARAIPPATTSLPVISLDQIDLAMSYVFGTSSSAGFSASLEVFVYLQANPFSDPAYSGAAQIAGSIDYNPSGWTLTGSITNLWASTLYQFFDADVQDAIGPVLQSILIQSVDVTYFYDTTGKVGKITLAGTFQFGPIQLDLTYTNPKDDGSWSFTGVAAPGPNQGKQAKLGDVLDSLIGTTGDLPDFVTNVPIEISAANDSIALNVQSLPDSTPGVFLRAAIKISAFTFQYIQYATAADAQSMKPMKRIFVASLDTFPTIPEIPLIGTIPQPFDEALFIYVQPQNGADGLNKTDVDMINTMLANDTLPPLPYKAVKKDPQPTDILIKNGMHFMLLAKSDAGVSTVVLDYTFGQTTPAPPPDQKDDKALAATDDSSTGTDPGMVGYSKTFGGLSVRNLGFGYSKDVLSVKLDATISLGPIAFELLGASLKVDFSQTNGSLSNISTNMLSFSIQGLAAAFDRAPLLLAGMFEAVNTNLVGYEGAVAVAFQPWMFAAAGFYGTMQPQGAPSYTTAFVYAMLNGPLFTFEFAQITGVTGGFGYNTNLKLPDAASVPSFPFIAPTPSGDAQSALKNLTGSGWFFPQNNCFWVAAGLTVTAFEILDIQAVVVVEWDPSIKLGLYGLATADIPSSIGGSGTTFAHVQLGLAATVDFAAGTLKIDGQLTPSSYILAPACHLVGGFALYSWFGDADPTMKGDWVFTIGGYHPQFQAPPQYPRPPRLGISWQFNSSIAITGQSYFAITPKVCMGGGRLDVTLSLGKLYAFLDAFVDFLINFKPFHFIADGGVSVGVKYTLNLWLVTLHISVEISCTLHIEGPPLHGTVHVNFWVFGFDINFGDNSNPFPVLSLDEFIELVCSLSQPLQAAVATITSQTRIKGGAPGPAPTPVENGLLHVFSVTDGLIPSNSTSSTPSGSLWSVRAATFSCLIACKFPADNIIVQTGVNSGDPPPPTTVAGSGNPLHARPMEQNNVTSTITVTITPDLQPDNADQKLLTLADPPTAVPIWNHDSGVFKNLPNGLWGTYSQGTDPSYNPNNNDLLDGTQGGTVNQLCGVNITRPDNLTCEFDTTKVFDYVLMSVETAATVNFPAPVAMPPAFLSAQPNTTGQQWELVTKAWETPAGPTTAVPLVESWIAIGEGLLGWDPEKVCRPKEKDDQLTGAPPTEVLLQSLDTYLLWAPLMTT